MAGEITPGNKGGKESSATGFCFCEEKRAYHANDWSPVSQGSAEGVAND